MIEDGGTTNLGVSGNVGEDREGDVPKGGAAMARFGRLDCSLGEVMGDSSSRFRLFES